MIDVQSKKEEIIQASDKLFMRYGARSVSMDDIASNLGVSKKTLYQYFESKSDLVNAVMDAYIAREKAVFVEKAASSRNAIHEMIEVSKHTSEMLANISPTIIYDIQKYYPEAFKKMEAFHHDHVNGYVRDNIRRGKSEGNYREAINEEVVALFYMSLVEIFKQNAEIFSVVSMTELNQEMMRYHMEGILTDNGRATFNKLTKTEQ